MTANNTTRFPLEDMIATAVRNGFAKAQLRTSQYIFKAASATSSNPGAIYIVTNSPERTYLGKLRDGRISLVPAHYSAAAKQAIIEIAQNPQAEALKYGQETGACSICGRPLVAKESVRFAIGPVCAEKVGFAFITGQTDILDALGSPQGDKL